MLIRELMTPAPTTIKPSTPVPEALHIIKEKNIRRLPVLDDLGNLVGIITEKDLLYASPSPVTSLTIWEINDLLSKLTVDKVMVKKVFTVTEDTPAEEAACIMADYKIGCLPVMRGSLLVGIVTIKDLLQAFLELLGGRRSGVRISAYTSGAKGTVAKITNAVFSQGGNIVGLGFKEVQGKPEKEWEITFKVQDVEKEKLVEAVRPVVLDLLDVRET
jgi:acetoin utilization protein AcuB